MRKFKFKLEVVLAERKRIEDVRLGEWTRARRDLIALIEELSVMEKRLRDAIDEATELNRSDNVGMLSTMDDFISGTKTRMVWKRREIDRAMKVTDKRRMEYMLASQKRNAIEKIKEKKLEAYKEQGRKLELKLLDDIYIMNGAARERMRREELGEEDEVAS